MRPATNSPKHAAQPHGGHGRGHVPQKCRVRLFTGDVVAGAHPLVLHTLLGSCVAVCLYDPMARIGGMNHILLPGGCKDCIGPRFGVHAMELLINRLMGLGVDRRRLIAKAFGGANVLGGMQQTPIGDNNARFVRDFLATERIPLVAERLGGDQAVHVYFEAGSGKATVHSVDGLRLPKILQAESVYSQTHLADIYRSGDITLF